MMANLRRLPEDWDAPEVQARKEAASRFDGAIVQILATHVGGPVRRSNRREDCDRAIDWWAGDTPANSRILSGDDTNMFTVRYRALPTKQRGAEYAKLLCGGPRYGVYGWRDGSMLRAWALLDWRVWYDGVRGSARIVWVRNPKDSGEYLRFDMRDFASTLVVAWG